MTNLVHRGIAIRLAGALLIAGAALCLYAFFHGPAAHRGGAGAIDVMEAAGGFVGVSFGAVLLLLGHHIHDRVRISRPWAGTA